MINNYKINVSIIIISYNTQNLTISCIKSIIQNTHDLKYEIIVIDNNSKDNTVKTIALEFPNINIQSLGKNIGFGNANNIGYKQSRGKYLLFLNSDTILLNNSVKIFYDFMERNQNRKIGAIGSILLNSRYQPIHSHGRFPTIKEILKGIICRYFNPHYYTNIIERERVSFDNTDCFSVDYITGADLFISSKIFNQVGKFDSEFFMYYEETQLQKKLELLGYERLIIDGPRIVHYEGASEKRPSYSFKKRKIIITSMFSYIRKNNLPHKYYIFKLLFILMYIPIYIYIKIKLIFSIFHIGSQG